MHAPDAAPNWTRVGRGLARTFEHVVILSLPTARSRRKSVAELMTEVLGLHRHEWSFFDALQCSSYGEWQPLPSLMEQWQSPPRGTAWWLHRARCSGGLEPPSCLHPEFEPCRNASPSVGGSCKYVCYTLTVAAALYDFVHRSGRNRTLLLEDDACPTPALARAGTLLGTLWWRAAEWGVVKLGHCDPCGQEETLEGGYAACLGSGALRSAGAAASSSAAARPHALRTTLGKSFCGHALGLTREGAAALLRLAFPVSVVFDDVLMALGGGFGGEAAASMARHAGLANESSLRALHSESSLIGQRLRAHVRGGPPAPDETARGAGGWHKKAWHCEPRAASRPLQLQARLSGKHLWADHGADKHHKP